MPTATDVFLNVDKNTCTLYVPIGSVDAYKLMDYNNMQWSSFANIVAMTTAVPTVNNSNLKVYTTQSAIIIDGTISGETVTIYNLNGNQLHTVKSQGERLSINVKFNGVYLVKIAGKTMKVVL